MLGAIADMHFTLFGRDELDRRLDRFGQGGDDLARVRVGAKILDLGGHLPRNIIAQALQLLSKRGSEPHTLAVEFLAAGLQCIALFLDGTSAFLELGALF